MQDWPPLTDFQIAFPDLYDDFSEAISMPDYVRRDGVLNIASHFPLNAVVPDLGKTAFRSRSCVLTNRAHVRS